MPVIPNALERLVLLRLNRGPGPVLELFGAAGFEAATLADRLGVFPALVADGPLSAAALAARLDADPDGLERLCEFLVALGYLDREGEEYAATAMARRWLTDAEGTDVLPWFRFWEELAFPYWREHAETAVRTGEPPATLYEWLGDDEERWRVAQEGFRAAAAVLAEDVAEALALPEGPVRLLDVGGGHGAYAVALAERRPDLDATVLDRPAALGAAREAIEAAGLSQRARAVAGDYETDPLGEGFDVALVFNVVHAHDGPEATALFERVADALAPGGTVAVLDQFEGTARTPMARVGVGFVGLTYLVTLGARAHPYEDVVGWLEEAGFEGVERETFRAGPGVSLVQARKAD